MKYKAATFWVSFSEPVRFKGPYQYSFARATFSKDAVFQNS